VARVVAFDAMGTLLDRAPLERRLAAHGWDVAGAQAAGLGAVWVDRGEREWPLPLAEPPRAPGLVEAAEVALGLLRR
jgi:FMN phosphatase YigB (HAD superfamily)